MEANKNFFQHYRAVSNKLKKKFLKKPNVAEASEEFNTLAKHLQQLDCPHYAGFCSLAVARCEHTLTNLPGEAKALTSAARQFLEAEKDIHVLKCISFDEHLTAAINCYSHAVRVHMENKQPALAAGLCIELADALRQLGKTSEAIIQYNRAAELQYQSPLDCLQSLESVAACQVAIGDYHAALQVLTDMTNMIEDRYGARPLGAYSDILAFCEVTRVLLLMLLQPSPQRIRPDHATLLERYAWECKEEEFPCYLNQDLFLLLQSVVMACQSQDVDSLNALQIDLWPLLSSQQNELLLKVVEKVSDPFPIKA